MLWKGKALSEKRLTIPAEATWGAAYGVGTWAAHAGLSLAEVDPALVGLGGLLATGLVGTAVSVHLTDHERCSELTRTVALTCTGILGIGDVAWLTYAQATGVVTGTMAAALAAGAAMVWGSVTAISAKIRRTAPSVAAARDAQRAAGSWGRVLQEAGYGHLRLLGEPERGEDRTTLRCTYPAKSTSLPTQAGGAEAIAAAVAAVFPRRRVTDSMVIVEPGGMVQSGTLAIHVLDHDVLGDAIEPSRSDRRRSIRDVFDLGRYVNGGVVEAMLWRVHGEIIGMTQSGKSTMLKRIILELLRCEDAEVWVGGVHKLGDLVRSFLAHLHRLRPGEAEHCPFGYVAADQRGVLEMLAAGWQEGNRRLALPGGYDGPSPALPSIVINLDEAHHVLSSPQRILCHDGVERNASELVFAITSGLTSVDVTVILATQRGTVDHYGIKGPDIKANIRLRMAFASADPADLPRVVPNARGALSNAKLQHPGAFYIQQGRVAVLLGKGYDITGAEIEAMMPARLDTCGQLPAELDDLLDVADGAYGRRWLDSLEEFLEYVRTGTRPRATPPASGPTTGPAPAVPSRGGGTALAALPSVQEIIRASDERMRQARRDHVRGLDQAAVDRAFADLVDPPLEIPTAARDRVQLAVAQLGTATRAEIVAWLAEHQAPVAEGTVTNKLAELARDGLVHRDGPANAPTYRAA